MNARVHRAHTMARAPTRVRTQPSPPTTTRAVVKQDSVAQHVSQTLTNAQVLLAVMAVYAPILRHGPVC
eukprot:COSAG05_NODE_22707_length_263_cov_0.579268_1_plen_68_part_01